MNSNTNDENFKGTPRDYSSPLREFVESDSRHKDKITEIRKGYYPLVARIVLLSLLLDFISLAIYIAVIYFSLGSPAVYFITIFILKTVVLLYTAITMTYRWSQTYFQFEGNRLVRLVGVYNPQQTVYNLNELNSVEVRMSFLGRILKYGHLSLIFKLQNGLQKQVEIPYAVEPLKLKSYISKYLD